jgi:hypothetical protein
MKIFFLHSRIWGQILESKQGLYEKEIPERDSALKSKNQMLESLSLDAAIILKACLHVVDAAKRWPIVTVVDS